MLHSVAEIRGLLKAEGILGVSEYCDRLKSQMQNVESYRDLLAEAYAALTFARSQFKVTMRDCPDLKLEFNGSTVGAEVKRFRRKEQDDIDDRRMEDANDFIEYGNTLSTEGQEAWEQIEDVLVKKCSQLWSGFPNVVVILSSSPHCIEETEVMLAVNSMSDRRTPSNSQELGRLNGVVFMSLEYNISRQRNVHFYECVGPTVALPQQASDTIAAIREWKTG